MLRKVPLLHIEQQILYPTYFQEKQEEPEKKLEKPIIYIKRHPAVTVERYEMPIEDTAVLGCYHCVSPVPSNITLFYIPGTANSIFYPAIEEGIGSHLAFTLECNVFVLFPRISAEHKFPIPLNDIVKSIEFLKNCQELNIDPTKTALGGYSSGGLPVIQLTLLCLEKKRMPFQQLLLFAPLIDLAENPIYPNHQDETFMTPQTFENAVHSYVPSSMTRFSSTLSPLRNSSDKFKYFPPTIFVYGTLDCLASSIQQFYNMLIQQGAQAYQHIIPGEKHGFPWRRTDYLSKILAPFQENFSPANRSHYNPSNEPLPIVPYLKEKHYCPVTGLIMRNPVVTEDVKCYEEEAITLKPEQYLKARRIKAKINDILVRNPDLIMENKVYLPYDFINRFRQAVQTRNFQKILELVQTDIRLLIYDPEELIAKRLTFVVEGSAPDNYTGFQFICERGVPELLMTLMSYLTPSLFGRYNIINRIFEHSKPSSYNPHVLNLALMKSVIGGQPQPCETFLGCGADITTTICNKDLIPTMYNDGRSPMHWAVDQDHLALVPLLLHYGADINVFNPSGWQPIHMVKSVPMLQLLIENKADITSMIPKHYATYGGWNTLHSAAFRGNVAVAQALLELAPKLVKQQSVSGDTPLHVVRKDSPNFKAMVTLLTKKGANVNALNTNGIFAVERVVTKDDPSAPSTVARFAAQALGEQAARATRKIDKYKDRITALEDTVEQLQLQMRELLFQLRSPEDELKVINLMHS